MASSTNASGATVARRTSVRGPQGDSQRRLHQRGDGPDPGRRDVVGHRSRVPWSSSSASIVPSSSRITPWERSPGLADGHAGASCCEISAASAQFCSWSRRGRPTDRSAASSCTDGVFGHASARYSWISDTAIEPSPTALATRLIERRPHVAGHEHARHAGLERARISRQRPAVVAYFGAGQDEPALVARDHSVEPVGARQGADEHEAGVDVDRALVAVGPAEPQPLQAAVLALRSGGHASA